MKKLIGLIAIVLIGVSSLFAQTATSKKVDKSTKAKTTAVHTKKDGTADMRYKENKAKKEGPKKKDGSLDMRYKANKGAAKKN